jgi:hypothetical protein
MRPALLAALVLALAAPAAGAARAPRVETMVVTRAGTPLADGPHAVVARATRVRVGARRCAVAAGTPLAALAALRRAGGPAFRVRDYASCSRRAADASGLYVSAIGGSRARGQDGWVYKVGNKVGTAGAADPSGPFGTGRRLRSGRRVLWFWCRMGARGCQRTLAVVLSARRVAAGASLRVTVRGYDDRGRAAAVAGATVTLTSGAAGTTSMATTDAAGGATVTAPNTAPVARVTATAPGLVASFPETVRVG